MISEKYQKILEEKGKPLGEIGIAEVALERAPALEAIGALRVAGIPILGGDVYKNQNGNIKSTYDNWYSQEEDYPSKEEYLKQSWAKAEQYIRNYNDPMDGSIFYTLVIPE